MNCHISESHSGKIVNQFDKHVHGCMKENNCHDEPYFEIYAFMSLKHRHF